MRVGDKVPVHIAGQVVAQASVKEMSEGTATLVVPASLVVMAVRTEIAQPEHQAETDSVIVGTDRADADSVETNVSDNASVDTNVDANVDNGAVTDSNDGAAAGDE